MFWDCPVILPSWSAVFGEINLSLQLSLPMLPALPLLGVHDDAHRSNCQKRQIFYLLLYAKKEILLKWILPSPPSLSSWEALIDDTLTMYRITSINRGCQWKYDSNGPHGSLPKPHTECLQRYCVCNFSFHAYVL